MKVNRYVFLCLLLSVAAVAPAGDIQVFCSPGLRVYLDGELMGTSSAKDDGLYLFDVPHGARTIRVEKDGFVPQIIEVEVSDFPIEVTVADLSPEPVVRYRTDVDAQTVVQLVGNLVITSAPQNCVVEIDGESQPKTTPQLTIEGLAAGEHTVTFSKAGYEPISRVVTIEPGSEVKIRGNLKAEKVESIFEGLGSLHVISKPERCTVRFRGQTRQKTQPKLNMRQIPAGKYPIVLSIPGRDIATTVTILDKKKTLLEVSFLKGDEPFVISHETF